MNWLLQSRVHISLHIIQVMHRQCVNSIVFVNSLVKMNTHYITSLKMSKGRTFEYSKLICIRTLTWALICKNASVWMRKEAGMKGCVEGMGGGRQSLSDRTMWAAELKMCCLPNGMDIARFNAAGGQGCCC